MPHTFLAYAYERVYDSILNIGLKHISSVVSNLLLLRTIKSGLRIRLKCDSCKGCFVWFLLLTYEYEYVE